MSSPVNKNNIHYLFTNCLLLLASSPKANSEIHRLMLHNQLDNTPKYLQINVQSLGATETIQYNTIQYSTIQTQYNTIQYNTIQYNTIQYNTIQYNTIQYNTGYPIRLKLVLLGSCLQTYNLNQKKVRMLCDQTSESLPLADHIIKFQQLLSS